MEVIKSKNSLKLKQSKLAIIDIGSNSIRMLIYEDFSSSRVPFFNEKAVCELGKNLDKSKKLHKSGTEYALKVLKRFSEILNVSKITNLKIIATAVLREATDTKQFIDEVEKLFKTKINILSGEEEAECSAEGVKIGFENVDGLVADLGGGSLELARVENNIVTNKTSLPFGVLRLLNNPIVKKRNLAKYIKKLLREEKWLSKKRFNNLYLVGGTWRSLFKLHLFQNNHPVHIIHQYSIDNNVLSKFVEKISSFNKSKLKTVEYISKSRTPYLPYSCIILDEIMRATNPKNIICSISGLREGSLSIDYFKDTKESEIFHKALENVAKKRGDLGSNYKKYYDFIQPVFEGNEHFNKKLLYLACVLSHMDWGLGAFQKAELVFQETINTPLLRLTHKERIQLALSCYWRYCSIKYNPKMEYLTFLNNNEIFSSKQVGAALRFSQSLTSISTIFLEEFKLYKRGNAVFLKIPSQHQEIISKQVTKRFKALARELFLEPRVIYSNNSK
ncbi:Ppx/GppA family phosphatase [Pelagibacterales bacterium SAG-MED07]|nr:Ppx/GppA family phosphatase [Pelagibacterales bacterium SAG-MED07]